MKLIHYFYRKDEYISPEEELIMYSELDSLLSIWKEIIVKHSDKKYSELNDSDKKRIFNIISQGYFNDQQPIGKQLDMNIVEVLIWGSIVSKKPSIIDEIYLKTKNSIFSYFHHELIINGYLKLGLEEKAIEVIKLIFNKDHIAYLFVLDKYDELKYRSYPKFSIKLKEYKQLAKSKLLSKGERIDLKDISLNELRTILDNVNKFLK